MKRADSKTLARILVSVAAVLIVAGTAYLSLSPNVNSYSVFSLLAVMAFVLEVGAGISMGFVFLILSLGHLGWIDTLMMADAALFLAAIIYPSRADPRVLLRDFVATSLATATTHAAFQIGLIPGVQAPIPIFFAACVCFLTIRLFEWKRSVLWSLPYYLVTASVSVLVPVTLVLPVLLLMIWRACRIYERRLTRQREHSSQVAALYLRTVEALAVAIEARDQPASRHSRRVRIYAEEMGRELELPDSEREALRIASLLYDVGELAVPEHIILKPGRLTPEEFDKVKTHPEVGADILEGVDFPYPVTPIVRAHHERWDGAGYPAGLKGACIPIGARILAIADAVDSLASSRYHRAALPVGIAVERVLSESGKAFDPALTALLAKRWRKWEKLVAKNLGSGLESIFEAQREAELLRHLSAKLSSSLDMEAIFTAVVQVLHRLLVFDGLVVWIAEKDGRLVPRHVSGDSCRMLAGLNIAPGGGVSGRAAFSGQAIINGDPSRENESEALTPLITPLRWALATPLKLEHVHGALTLYRSGSRAAAGKSKVSGEGFTADDARLVNMIAPLLATAMAKAMQYQDASHRAGADPLTGLPNAAALAARMSVLSAPCAVVVCDLDGFKEINDSFGHLTGNRLLEAIAHGFQRSCRSDDFVARLGGDEFVLLLDRGRPEEIEPRLAHFREMVRATGRQIACADVLDASFGTAYYPADGKSPDELLKLADKNMYFCKEQHKTGVLALDRNVRVAEAAASGSASKAGASLNHK